MSHHPSRWGTEANVLGELEHLNDLSMSLVQEYKAQAVEAAKAEASHKALRAKRVLTAQASGVTQTGRNMSVAQAETTAEADETVAEAYQHRLVTAALADATKEAMRSVRTNQDSLRTAAASHRNQIA